VEFIPDISRLSDIFGIATAPAFFLGTIAGFISLMSGRLSTNVDRLRRLRAGASSGEGISHAEDYARLLKNRIELLNSAIRLSLAAGISATSLLAVLFLTAFVGLKYAYGAGTLFMVSNVLLGISLWRFAQEVRIGLTEWDLN